MKIQKVEEIHFRRSLGMGAKYSDKTKEIFDKEALDLVKDAFEEALDLLNANKNTLDLLIDKLEKNKILDNKSVMIHMDNNVASNSISLLN